MPSGLPSTRDTVARLGSLILAGLNLSCIAFATVHGAWQLARDANRPSCLDRQSRAAGAPLARERTASRGDTESDRSTRVEHEGAIVHGSVAIRRQPAINGVNH